MSATVATPMVQSVGKGLESGIRAIANNPTARKVALVGTAYFIGPCALAVATAYLGMHLLGSSSLLEGLGVNDPFFRKLEMIVGCALLGAACFEALAMTAGMLKVATLCASVIIIAPAAYHYMTAPTGAAAADS